MEPHWITGWQYADGTKRRNPMVLGCEFAGRVHSANMRDATFADGQSVVGMTGQYRKGAMAQFVSARTADLLPMPEALSFEDASTLPLAGLTAWQALIRYGKLAQGERVLIHGGAGGVGTFAIQIARWAGAHVVTTAASGDADLCRRLGADEAIDYEHQRFDEGGKQYDLVFDQFGGDVQERSWHVLKRGGRLVTIAGEETDAPDQDRAKALGVSACFFIVDRNTSELSRLIELVRNAVIKPIIGKRGSQWRRVSRHSTTDQGASRARRCCGARKMEVTMMADAGELPLLLRSIAPGDRAFATDDPSLPKACRTLWRSVRA